ncbi:MAG: TfoX/Sxy family protein [Myxococcales bacterium]|nr:TfoX/Sxy family protein [Myxococcales bacterium]
MPRGSKYQGPPEALDQYIAAIEQSSSGAEVKGAKNPYTSRNGHMFSFLDATGAMALRLSSELTETFRADHESGDVQQHGATMRGYSSVPATLLADTQALTQWIDRSWEWIGTLPPKPTKKS